MHILGTIFLSDTVTLQMFISLSFVMIFLSGLKKFLNVLSHIWCKQMKIKKPLFLERLLIA